MGIGSKAWRAAADIKDVLILGVGGRRTVFGTPAI
jgi:hypothetical protein